MQSTFYSLSLVLFLAPLIGSIIAGVFGKKIGRTASHRVTIVGMGLSFIAALWIAKLVLLDGIHPININLYTWVASGVFKFNVSFLIDQLTAVMIVTVTFVSLLVHIYTIGYMHDDDGYQRFFAYMSLFTFFMLMLVLANNFMLLFFGWEGVGLVSYLLIGFWYNKESAVQGSLKAFLVNRVGDLGFLLGLAALLDYFGSLDYSTVFAKAPQLVNTTISIFGHTEWSVITVICILLFIGAMGKSAQIPLHVWLPESMEGPTPISALIHAATMVTAGVYMVARISPLIELSVPALSTVLVIGAAGALFMGIIGLVQMDIKRVIAYSTMSQLGYMMAANGASAFSAGIYHLITHANFKALLFLAAGSVIIGMHHEQDMRKMGNLRKYMPITYVTFLVGGLALAAIPPFAGFYSKDAIIEAVHLSSIPGATFAYWCLTIGAFVTALYTFRAFFMTFHGKENIPAETKKHLKESPWVVTVPLVILAITSTGLGLVMTVPMLYSNTPLLGSSIFVADKLNVMAVLASQYHNVWAQILEAFSTLPFWFAVSGVVLAYLLYVRFTDLPAKIVARFKWVYAIIEHKYGFDAFNDWLFVRGTKRFSSFCFNVADMKLLDGAVVNGSGRGMIKLSNLARKLQSGYLYHYAFAMIIGLCVFLVWLLVF